MDFLRKNTALSLGLGLPLLIVVLFGFASVLPRYFVAPPQHELLFATDYNEYGEGMRFDVRDGALQAYYTGQKVSGYIPPRLYRFNPAAMEIRQIRYEIPSTVQTRDYTQPFVEDKSVHPVTIEETVGLTLYPELLSPDGYMFYAGDYYRAGGGFLFEIFYGGTSYRTALGIGKSGHMISIPLPDGYRYASSAKLIGWIEK